MKVKKYFHEYTQVAACEFVSQTAVVCNIDKDVVTDVPSQDDHRNDMTTE